MIGSGGLRTRGPVPGLLMGTPMGNSAVIATGWCVVIALGGYLWSKKLFNRESTR